MNFSASLLIIISLVQIIRETVMLPITEQPEFRDYLDEDPEERRRQKIKKKRRPLFGRPCTRSEDAARWFFGHDLTIFLGDVTICGNNGIPANHNNDHNNEDEGSNPGLYEGVVPTLQYPSRPHRPFKPHKHKPHKPFRPGGIKPVEEDVNEEIQDNYYKPGLNIWYDKQTF